MRRVAGAREGPHLSGDGSPPPPGSAGRSRVSSLPFFPSHKARGRLKTCLRVAALLWLLRFPGWWRMQPLDRLPSTLELNLPSPPAPGLRWEGGRSVCGWGSSARPWGGGSPTPLPAPRERGGWWAFGSVRGAPGDDLSAQPTSQGGCAECRPRPRAPQDNAFRTLHPSEKSRRCWVRIRIAAFKPILDPESALGMTWGPSFSLSPPTPQGRCEEGRCLERRGPLNEALERAGRRQDHGS